MKKVLFVVSFTTVEFEFTLHHYRKSESVQFPKRLSPLDKKKPEQKLGTKTHFGTKL